MSRNRDTDLEGDTLQVEAHGHESPAEDVDADTSPRTDPNGSQRSDGRAPESQTSPAGPVPTEIQSVVDALDDKRAKDIVVLDLHGVSASLDWFVIATGESALQLRALEHGVLDELKEHGVRPRGVEGPSDRWILLDYGSIVVHIMSPDARAFYDLEGLWADAERVVVTPA